MLLHVQICAFKVGKRSNSFAFPDGLDRRLILMVSGPMFHDVRRWGLTTGGRSWVGMGALACFRSSLMSDRSWGSCASELQTFRDYPFIEVLEALKMDELCVPEGANSERVTVSGPT